MYVLFYMLGVPGSSLAKEVGRNRKKSVLRVAVWVSYIPAPRWFSVLMLYVETVFYGVARDLVAWRGNTVLF